MISATVLGIKTGEPKHAQANLRSSALVWKPDTTLRDGGSPCNSNDFCKGEVKW
jgi:hypothetical protein